MINEHKRSGRLDHKKGAGRGISMQCHISLDTGHVVGQSPESNWMPQVCCLWAWRRLQYRLQYSLKSKEFKSLCIWVEICRRMHKGWSKVEFLILSKSLKNQTVNWENLNRIEEGGFWPNPRYDLLNLPSGMFWYLEFLRLDLTFLRYQPFHSSVLSMPYNFHGNDHSQWQVNGTWATHSKVWEMRHFFRYF